MRWLLARASTNGVIQMRLRGVPTTDRVPEVVVPRIVRAVSRGLAAVETTAERPDFFTDRALELSQDIAERSAEIGPVRVTDGDVSTAITPAGVGQHVSQLLGARYTDRRLAPHRQHLDQREGRGHNGQFALRWRSTPTPSLWVGHGEDGTCSDCLPPAGAARPARSTKPSTGRSPRCATEPAAHPQSL